MNGQSLLKGTTYKETYQKNQECKFVFGNKSMSPDLEDLIRRAGAKDIEHRLSPNEFVNHDVFMCEISDSDDFTISYNPSMMMYSPQTMATYPLKLNRKPKLMSHLENIYGNASMRRGVTTQQRKSEENKSEDSDFVMSHEIFSASVSHESHLKSGYNARGRSKNNLSFASKYSMAQVESEGNNSIHLKSSFSGSPCS